jgi:hypothetical protein
MGIESEATGKMVGLLPWCAVNHHRFANLRVFYWSIELRVNATQTSETISAKLAVCFPCMYPGNRQAQRERIDLNRRKNDRFSRFGNAGLCVHWVNGVWDPGGLLDPSCGIRRDSATEESCKSQDPAGNRKRFIAVGLFNSPDLD